MELHEFIKNHRYGIDLSRVDEGHVLFDYLPFEKKLFNHILDNRFSIIKKSRQMHMTTMLATYVAWHLLFNEEAKHQIIYYVANNAPQNNHFVGLVRALLVRYGVKMEVQPINNRSEMLLDTGNCLKTMCASPVSFCSLSFKRAHMIIFDEAAHISQFGETYRSILPSISEYDHTKIVIPSTPCGSEKFHMIYVDSKKEQNNFKWLELLWWNNPKYDEEWLEVQRKMLHDKSFRQEILAEFIAYEPKKKKSKTNTIQIRLDDDMMNKLGTKLIEKDQSMSEYVRELIASNLN